MKWSRAALWALLVITCVALATAARDRGAASEIPSMFNHGPRGVAGVAALLDAAGLPAPSALRGPLSTLPGPTRTLVLVAPTVEKLSTSEVAELRARVEGGLRLVYFSPRPVDAQPALNAWLEFADGPWLPLADLPDADLSDLAGTTARVGLREGWLGSGTKLRLGADRSILPTSGSWVPAAAVGRAAVAWTRQEGKGEVWVLGGPELAENARLTLLDNAQVWLGLGAQGALVFDERFHVPRAVLTRRPLLLAALLQLLFCGCIFAWSRGVRLGPPREPSRPRNRSSDEHLGALAGLLGAAHVERELILEQMADLRRQMAERWGLPTLLPLEELAQQLEMRAGVPRALTSAYFEEARIATSAPGVTRKAYTRLARVAALLEAHMEGNFTLVRPPPEVP